MTQTEQVQMTLEGKEMSIKEISQETSIKEPNVRRILGQGAKKGVFTRLGPGLYTITVGDSHKAIIQCGDALDTVRILKEQPYKFDMVFLDIPYNTPAVKGGNRGIKYECITPEYFRELLTEIKQVVKPGAHIYHMFSNAPSGMKAMMKYNQCFEALGYKLIAEGSWQKLFQNGKLATNMRGDVMPPEGLHLYSLEEQEVDVQMSFTLAKTNTASEKPESMIDTLVQQSTQPGDRVLDPFAGTGVLGSSCLRLLRNIFLIEKDSGRIEKEILPRLQAAV